MSQDDLVYTPDRPWLPPATPIPFPEGRLTPEWVGKVARRKAGNAPVDLVLRSHLKAMEPNDPRYMASWRTFWRALAFSDRQNIIDLLSDWLAAATAAQGDPAVSEEEATWINRFIVNVEAAIARLDRAKNEPMSWAGAEYAKYPPEQRARVEALIAAIVLHRKGNIGDEQLYTVLGSLYVDPDDFDQGISEQNLTRIMDACVTGAPIDFENTYRRNG